MSLDRKMRRVLRSAALFLLAAVSLAAPQDECLPASCGDHSNVTFPFWVEDIQPPSCGIPSFKLTCRNQILQIVIANLNYTVKEFNYSTETLVLAPLDYRIFACLTLRSGFIFNSTPFSLFPGGNDVFFHFNCSRTFDPEFYGSVTCGGMNNSFVGWREENPGAGVCERVSRLPSAASVKGNYESWERILDDGFFVKWRAVNCSKCQLSGGKCRYNLLENRFGCLCGKKLVLDSCQGNGINLGRKIAIGVSSGIGGVLLAGGLIFFILWKRRQTKKLSDPPKLLSWTNSSEKSLKDIENSVDSMGPPFFRYEELHDATNGFSPSNELGDGGFGTVYKGKLKDGRIVAVKRLYENNFKRVEQFLNEAAILNRLRHPNLVSLYGCTSRHSRELLLVYEFIPNGTVADHLHGSLASRHELTWPLRFRIALETATALAYLHAAEPQIIHRDVKTTNILLDANFHVKVADFGLSRLFPLDVTHVSTAPQGTPGYVDPEYHQCYQLTDKSDVYSFGVVLVELISSMPAVDITRRRNEINLSNLAISKIQSGQLEEIVDPQLGFKDDLEVRRTVEVVAELAFRCLQGEKEMRPSMEDIVEALVSARNGGVRERDEMKEKKMDEMGLLNAVGAPPSPNSVTYKWSSRVTTPNASQ